MNKIIQVFEHQTLKIGQHGLTNNNLQALQQHYGIEGKLYYTLINNGVKFNQYVGVIQIEKLIIHVLPKIDNLHHSDNVIEDEIKFWNRFLIDMLMTVTLESQITGVSNLSLKANSILDVYFALFLNEVESLLKKGLIRKYHKKQENLSTLKGRLKFHRHIIKNIVHQERFFVEYNVYDSQNFYNQIVYKTLKLIRKLNVSQFLFSRIDRILANFPEMEDIYVTQHTFEKVAFNRQNQNYRYAFLIAKLLLLNYHPDILKGKSSVLSLMFDMNILWEKFVLLSIHRYNRNEHIQITHQRKTIFWVTDSDTSKIKPDILIFNKKTGNNFVLDTKWKCLKSKKPEINDLRQLYVYHHYCNAKKVGLIFPSRSIQDPHDGKYVKINEEPDKICSLLFLNLPNEMNRFSKWQEDICNYIFKWIGII